MTVSIVVPNYNGEKFLRECIGALNAQTMKDFELIIVDNGSTDKSLDIVRETRPDTRIIELDKNYGFSRAVNEGIRASEAEYVILLNNDTRALPDFTGKLYNAIRKDKEIFSVSARMLRMDAPHLIDSAGDMYCCLGWAFARGKDKPRENYDKPAEVFSSCAGAAIYRKAVFEEIGYFDEAHFAYLEDVDVGYRARISGYRNMYEPEAEVYHVGSGMSGSRYNRFKIGLSSRNNVYLIYKNMPFIQLLLNLPFLALGFLVKTAFFAARGEGRAYVKGLLNGMSMCRRGRKYSCRNKKLRNYIKIQLELWRNTILRFIG